MIKKIIILKKNRVKRKRMNKIKYKKELKENRNSKKLSKYIKVRMIRKRIVMNN